LSQQPVPGTRPLSRTGAGSSRIPYLALHPMGFSVPPRLRLERRALTPPFHPCPASRTGRFVFCGTVRRGASRRRLPRVSPAPRPLAAAGVTRHRALWCSDFPPPPAEAAGSDSPPFQNRPTVPWKRPPIKRGADIPVRSSGRKRVGDRTCKARAPLAMGGSLRTGKSALRNRRTPAALRNRKIRIIPNIDTVLSLVKLYPL